MGQVNLGTGRGIQFYSTDGNATLQMALLPLEKKKKKNTNGIADMMLSLLYLSTHLQNTTNFCHTLC